MPREIGDEETLSMNVLVEIQKFVGGEIVLAEGGLSWPHLRVGDVSVTIVTRSMDKFGVIIDTFKSGVSCSDDFPTCNPNLIGNMVAYVKSKIEEIGSW